MDLNWLILSITIIFYSSLSLFLFMTENNYPSLTIIFFQNRDGTISGTPRRSLASQFDVHSKFLKKHLFEVGKNHLSSIVQRPNSL